MILQQQLITGVGIVSILYYRYIMLSNDPFTLDEDYGVTGRDSPNRHLSLVVVPSPLATIRRTLLAPQKKKHFIVATN